MFSCDLTSNEGTSKVLTAEQASPDNNIYKEVDKIPEPIGGFDNYYRWIGKTMTYPESARKSGIEGKVYVRFVIDKNGNLTDAQIEKGMDQACDQESLRVIKLSPKWTPGIKDGSKVNVEMVLPITFKLS